MNENHTPLSMDVTSLLAPISEAEPAGAWLRYETIYDDIREARRHDDTSLPQGIWQTRVKTADWSEVQHLCTEALAKRSKDLQVAAWLLEAWICQHGFAGYAQGIHLITQLCEGYWDTAYPAWDPEEPDGRMAPFVWINDKLTLPLKRVPLTQPQTTDATVYTWLEWEQALHRETLAARDPQATEAANAVTRTQILGSAMLTPVTFYLQLKEELQNAREATTALDQVLVAHSGDQAPSLRQCHEVLQEMQHLVKRCLADRAEEVEDHLNTASGAGAVMPASAAAPTPGGGPIRSRAEAYQRLSEVGEYLLRTEPHSPVPYLIKRAVVWGSMPLHKLLEELVYDQNDLYAIFNLLGMHTPEGGDPLNRSE